MDFLTLPRLSDDQITWFFFLNCLPHKKKKKLTGPRHMGCPRLASQGLFLEAQTRWANQAHMIGPFFLPFFYRIFSPNLILHNWIFIDFSYLFFFQFHPLTFCLFLIRQRNFFGSLFVVYRDLKQMTWYLVDSQFCECLFFLSYS
jgi:hypothetical protein